MDNYVGEPSQPRRRLEFKHENSFSEDNVEENGDDVDYKKKVEFLRSKLSNGVIPKVGLEFDTEEEAYKFYNAYAYKVGLVSGNTKLTKVVMVK